MQMPAPPQSPLKNCTLEAISPTLMGGFIALSSALALAGAFTAQYGFGLLPCELCLMQRIPFALNILLGTLSMLYAPMRPLLIGLSGVAFLINSGIAFFHSGVERKWWVGLTGCTTPDMSGSIEDLLKRIEETAVVRCDEIPWSLFGLSMANYNVVFCLCLGILSLLYVKTLVSTKHSDN